MQEKIIIVDDNDSFRIFLVQFLGRHGFEVVSCSYRNHTVIDLIRSHEPDLIILDLLPGSDCLEVCAKLRIFSDKPILFMSSRSNEKLIISGLSAGGDHYIRKPFDAELLLAQVKAQFRRYERAFPANQRHLLSYPGLHIDLSAQLVMAYGKEALLSAKEFQLLAMLAKSPSRVFHTEALYERIWKDNGQGDIRTVMVHIYNLRQKIELDPRKPLFIHTVRGVGYRFNGIAAPTTQFAEAVSIADSLL
ncbi:Transcriptional regulatory protein WalR [compost metagenome]